MLQLFDSSQSKVSTDQYQVTLSWAQELDSIAGSSQVITSGESEGEHAKTTFWRKLYPDALLTFLPTYSLHKSLIYCVSNLYNLGYTQYIR